MKVSWWRIHNAYAFVLYVAGLPALVSLLAMLLGTFFLLWKRLSLSPSPEIGAALLVTFSIAVSINVIGSVFNWGAAWAGAIWGLAGAWAVSPSARSRENAN